MLALGREQAVLGAPKGLAVGRGSGGLPWEHGGPIAEIRLPSPPSASPCSGCSWAGEAEGTGLGPAWGLAVWRLAFPGQVRELKALGFGERGPVLEALYQNHGDLWRALLQLQRHRLEPFHKRLWEGEEPPLDFHSPDRQVRGRPPARGRGGASLARAPGPDPTLCRLPPCRPCCAASWPPSPCPAGAVRSWWSR